MIFLLLATSLAFAGGGDDHDHGPPVATAASASATTADAVSMSAASSTFEAIVRVPRAPAGTATEASLLLADYATSAPVEGATASLTLNGPGASQAEFGAAGAPGAYHGTLTLPAYGDYAGALVVTAPAASDLLAISGLHYDPPSVESGDGMGAGTVALAGAGVLALIGGVAVVCLGLGFLLGRRRGAAAAATLLAIGVGLASRRVSAHGGEDHGEASAAPTAPAGATLALPMDGQFLVGLRTAILSRDVFVDRVPALGRFVARPGEAATLGAPVDGVLVAPPGGFPSPGQAVKAGDTLALLKEVPSTADRASIAQERGSAATRVAQAKSALALAERDASSLDTLGDSISERERLERKNAVEVARVTLREAEGALAALAGGVTVAIRAPVDGRLGAINARPGDQVSAGATLFRVVDTVGLWMEANVPERLALGLVSGASAMVTPSAAPGRSLSAVVLDAGQEADPATGMVTITLAVEAGDLGLRPGMGATAWIGRGATRDALVVPAAAVVDSNGARLAFVKTGPEAFEARDLRLGGRSGGSWEVLGGLAPGERVVVDGTYTLRSMAGR
ncbi:MAG: efflux RND transporter periplasmic adaptor subunit [Pseudomonadota bacterium]|nr:efflux RND transporter periplasmic adaptor subunit [Pseudomonadota bacterium]